jgi:hypothetical protein
LLTKLAKVQATKREITAIPETIRKVFKKPMLKEAEYWDRLRGKLFFYLLLFVEWLRHLQ